MGLEIIIIIILIIVLSVIYQDKKIHDIEKKKERAADILNMKYHNISCPSNAFTNVDEYNSFCREARWIKENAEYERKVKSGEIKRYVSNHHPDWGAGAGM